MKHNVNYVIANPAGNITILVLSPVKRTEYQRIARFLLEKNEDAEQVGYILTPDQCLAEPADAADYNAEQEKARAAAVSAAKAGLPRMEMCGLELCGNASRAFGYYAAMQHEPPLGDLDISVSGSDAPLHVTILSPEDENTGMDMDSIGMPVPVSMEEIRIPLKDGKNFIEGRLVHMEGISHLVITSFSSAVIRGTARDEMEALFCYLRDEVYRMSDRDLPAFGIMFYDPADTLLTPIVYVRDVDTIYFEGSCASGSSAAAYALAAGAAGDDSAQGRDQESLSMTYTFRQPAGTLSVEVRQAGGKVEAVELMGDISISEIKSLEIE